MAFHSVYNLSNILTTETLDEENDANDVHYNEAVFPIPMFLISDDFYNL